MRDVVTETLYLLFLKFKLLIAWDFLKVFFLLSLFPSPPQTLMTVDYAYQFQWFCFLWTSVHTWPGNLGGFFASVGESLLTLGQTSLWEVLFPEVAWPTSPSFVLPLLACL